MSNIAKFESVQDEERKALLKKTFCADLTDAELELFCHVCKQTGMDPFIKQIYAVKRQGKMTIQVGIDGLRSIAEKSGNYSPGKEPLFQYKNDSLFSSTAYVKKKTSDGTWHEVSATAFYSEYAPAYTNNFWKDKPHVMLSKCAEALAIRRAFPSVTANLYTKDEMDQADPTIDSDSYSMSKHSECQIIDPRPSKAGSESIEQMSCMRALIIELESDGIPSEKLAEWIKLRCDLKNQSEVSVIKACLEKDVLPKFKTSFGNWLKSQNEPVETAV